MDPKADLRGLERDRKRLLRERDADGLERLAGEAGELPKSGARDRFIYAARQNAAYSRRAGPEESRGMLIGVLLLTVGIVAGFAALGASADWSSTETYDLYNDRQQSVSVWYCASNCAYYSKADDAGPGETVDLLLGEEGDVFLIAGADGRVLGCLDLPPASIGTTTLNLSEAELCPAGAPSSVG